MIRKIRSSLWLKIFLSLTAILFAVCFLLYGIITTVMPASYRSRQTAGYTQQLGQLVTDLERGGMDDAINRIYEFCLNYNAAASLSNGQNTFAFGDNTGADKNDPAQTATSMVDIGGEAYLFSVTVSGQVVNQITQTFLNLLPVISLLIIAISILTASAYAHFLSKPILKISDISKRLTALDMTWRCDTSRTDEVGTLALNLNTMAARLDSTLKELSAANEKLQADIEQERRQEKLRVDFFRAVSHELKTPITVLKGELEGMIYQVGEYKDRDTYLRQSLRTVNEMELLVKEILSASRMAGNDFSLTLSEVDLSQLVRECCRKWRGAAEDREQACHVEIEDSITIEGDMTLLQKAVSNIIGNAVIHSPERAAIYISLQSRKLRVENSGVSIDTNDLNRIFEPFYRVDTSHNRGTGGSGLGLYIVKNILDRHRLNFRVENVSDCVCFTVQF